ncbi:MAG: hypothetical protein FJ303_21500 [Planctomycetes bacterium]|nr:hypothetical protein [Planctomycetota bacterium]
MESNSNPDRDENTEFHGDYQAFIDGPDPFAETDEWIAAMVRQLFRAHRANDLKAVEATLLYLNHNLTLALKRDLVRVDSAWGQTPEQVLKSGVLDLSRRRWFDGLWTTPEYLAPGHLRLVGDACWVQEDSNYYDPFEFEIELSAATGAFRWYVMRFGDRRSLKEKVPDSVIVPPKDGWVYKFTRGSRKETGSHE